MSGLLPQRLLPYLLVLCLYPGALNYIITNWQLHTVQPLHYIQPYAPPLLLCLSEKSVSIFHPSQHGILGKNYTTQCSSNSITFHLTLVVFFFFNILFIQSLGFSITTPDNGMLQNLELLFHQGQQSSAHGVEYIWTTSSETARFAGPLRKLLAKFFVARTEMLLHVNSCQKQKASILINLHFQ